MHAWRIFFMLCLCLYFEEVRGGQTSIPGCVQDETRTILELNEGPLAKLSRQYGESWLRHYTKLENIIEIIESGTMELPKNLPKEKIRSYNYTPHLIMFNLERSSAPIKEGNFESKMSDAHYIAPELFPVRDSRFTNLDQVQLRYSLDAMDGRDFHISEYSGAYGQYREGVDFRSTRSKPTLAAFYSKGRVGEVGFYEPVPNKYLQEIWVSPARRDELISRLKAKGFAQLNGKSIEEIVKSPPESAYTYIKTKDIHLPENFNHLKSEYIWVIVPNQPARK